MRTTDQHGVRIPRPYADDDAGAAFPDGVGARGRAKHRAGTLALAALASLALAAWFVRSRTNAADRARPPQGRFIEADGVRLHCVVRGDGPAVVLLHGSGSLVDEIESSSLVDVLAQHYRVIVLERPGFGYSERPPRDWTPPAQASLVASALERLGIARATIVGHSWGTLVALALALDHPDRVRGLVLASGFYYPTFRPDAFLLSAPDWPVVGPLTSRTTSPLAARGLWPALVRLVFGPPATPLRFSRLSPWRFLKPGRLRAAAAESGMLVEAARRLSRRYGAIRVPTVILAGEADRLVSLARHARRLKRAIAGSVLHTVPGAGHMLHHTVPERVLRAVDEVALEDARGAGPPAERTSQPLRQLLREVPHRDDALRADR